MQYGTENALPTKKEIKTWTILCSHRSSTRGCCCCCCRFVFFFGIRRTTNEAQKKIEMYVRLKLTTLVGHIAIYAYISHKHIQRIQIAITTLTVATFSWCCFSFYWYILLFCLAFNALFFSFFRFNGVCYLLRRLICLLVAIVTIGIFLMVCVERYAPHILLLTLWQVDIFVLKLETKDED